jgi:methanogenic corrinoid protein MtbC1
MAQRVIDSDSEAAESLAQALKPELTPGSTKGFVLGVNHVGSEFSCGNAFLPELVMAGEAMKTAVSTLEPEMARRGTERQVYGKVVIGTIEGDIHDIGKTLVPLCWRPPASKSSTWVWMSR